MAENVSRRSKMTEEQRKAYNKQIQGYINRSTKSLTIRFFPSDMHLLEYAKSQDNTAGYIKELIRRDMEGRDS